MSIAEVNGQRIAYDDSGAVGDALPLILAQGFLMDRSMFDPQVAALAADRRVIVWDERGHGDTVDDGQPFTYWDSAADCLALLDHLGIERAVVGGMSQGGFVSLRVALDAPDRVAGLVLIDTQAGTEDPEVAPLYQGMIDDWVTNGPSEELAQIVAGIIIDHPHHSAAYIAKWLAQEPDEMRERAATLMGRDDIWDRIGEITCPALVIHGTNDTAISMDKAERLAAGLPGSGDVVRIEGGTHSANLTHPEPVNDAIRTFLAGL